MNLSRFKSHSHQKATFICKVLLICICLNSNNSFKYFQICKNFKLKKNNINFQVIQLVSIFIGFFMYLASRCFYPAICGIHGSMVDTRHRQSVPHTPPNFETWTCGLTRRTNEKKCLPRVGYEPATGALIVRCLRRLLKRD